MGPFWFELLDWGICFFGGHFILFLCVLCGRRYTRRKIQLYEGGKECGYDGAGTY